jgi:NAD(P)-dependent dehydrogenase (short-subunit alcohol dehydrogenase family)
MERTAQIAQRYQGKVSVITGGTSGIGLGIAERVLAEGSHVVVCSIDKNIDEVVQQLKAKAPTPS